VSAWNFGDVWEAIAAAQPEAVAQVQGGRRTTWSDFDTRADGIAAALLDPATGAERQSTVAQYLYTAPEYLESVFACWKAGLVPVNTNYRYVED
jgi:acyl-CoA synthetase (AMP-forming)/AMP-acid ligase II